MRNTARLDSLAATPRRSLWSGGLMALMILFTALLAQPAAAQPTVTIAEARNQGVDATVTVEGTVTRAFGSFVRFQDASGATGASALVIRQTGGAFNTDVADGTITRGTELRVTGTLTEFNGLLQINEDNLSSYDVLGAGTVPAPQVVSLNDLASNGETYESELVAISNLSLQTGDATFANGTTYSVAGAGGDTFPFRVQQDDETTLDGTAIPQGAFQYEGVVGQFFTDYQLIPIQESDLQSARSFAFDQAFVNAQEGDASVSVNVEAFNVADGDQVSVTVDVAAASTASISTDVTGFSGPQTLTFNGPDPAPQTLTVGVVDDSDTEGLERLELQLSSSEGAIAEPGRFTVWIRDDATSQGTIANGETGETLVQTLQATYGSAPTLGYDIARDSLYRTIYNDGGTVEGIYTGFSVPVDPNGGDASQQAGDGGVNTEHIWPRSQGSEDEPALSDMHILAPARAPVNTARSNYAFGEIPDTDTDAWYFDDQSQSTIPTTNIDAWSELDDSPSTRDDRRFEPRESVKGDVARAAFYFVTMYPSRANLQFYEQQRETLFQWHQDDPADAAEVRRNIFKASYQGNKINPFIIDPTLVDRAYFSGGGSPTPSVLSIEEARQEGSGATVTVQGVVTRLTDDGPYIQDDTGGLYVFESQGAFGSDLGGNIQVGTELEVTGSLTFFNGLLELTDVGDSQYSVVSQGNALPDPALVTLSDLAQEGERYESELVRVENIEIDLNGDTVFQESTNYSVTDPSLSAVSDAVTLRIPGGSPLAGIEIPATATFVGALGQFNDGGFGADEPDTGYQLLGLEESDLQPPVTAIPEETTLNADITFGSTGETSSYRLVALAGQGNQLLASTLSGAPGVEWTAFRETGADQDFLQPYENSDAFELRPGRGFWLLSASDWTVEETVPTVSITNDAVTIPLQSGWNIISNPLPVDVAWAEVEGTNGGSLQPLWQWSGSFQETSTFAAATQGEAFYFLNDQDLPELTIPVGPTPATATPTAQRSRMVHRVVVSATGPDGAVSRVQVGEIRDAERGMDRFDHVAPPTEFSETALRVRSAGTAKTRQHYLARDARSPGSDGQTYTLDLFAENRRPVSITAETLPAAADTRVLLVDDATGREYDLRATPSLSVTPSASSSTWTLHVGTASFVNSKMHVAPTRTIIEPPAPNPFREMTSIEYVLPEAKDVTVAVYDLLGRRVHVLADGRQSAGRHSLRWMGTGADGAPLSSGMYFVRMTLGDVQEVHKVVHLR